MKQNLSLRAFPYALYIVEQILIAERQRQHRQGTEPDTLFMLQTSSAGIGVNS